MFFKIADVITPVFIGGITAFAVLLSVTYGESMLLAMIIGMFWGMAAQIIVLLFLMPLLGALEVMIPSMLSGMLSGMASGMIAASGPTGASAIIGGGMLIGLFVYGWVTLYNLRLHGEKNNG